MTTKAQLRIAADTLPARLSKYDEFVGVGTVRKDTLASAIGSVRKEAKDKTLVVAVYVSKPTSELSRDFVENIPKEIPVRTRSGTNKVETAIVNVGQLTL